jgi:hypothetical protein
MSLMESYINSQVTFLAAGEHVAGLDTEGITGATMGDRQDNDPPGPHRRSPISLDATPWPRMRAMESTHPKPGTLTLALRALMTDLAGKGPPGRWICGFRTPHA